MRIFQRILACLYLLLVGCSTTQTTPEREEVLFWHFWGGRDRPVVERIVERFNATQGRYRVKAVALPGNNLDLKFFLSLVGGDPPDLLNQDDPIVADWAHRGALVPLSDLASEREYSELETWLFPAAHRLSSYAGRLYAMPNGLDIRALYYNKTLLEEHKLEPPEELEDLDRIAATIAPPSKNQPLSRIGYLPDPRRLWAWGIVFGGEFYNPMSDTPTGAVTSDNPRVLAALQWMSDYSKRYGESRVTAFRSGDQALTGAAFPLLNNRRYAVIMDGQWRVRDIQLAKTANKNGDEYGVVPLPPPPGGKADAGWVNGNFFVVPRSARNPEGAWEFMKFWSGFGGNEAEAATACAEGGWIPVSQSVVDEPIFQAKLHSEPLLQTFVELAGSPNQEPTPAMPVASFYYREVISAAQDVMYRGQDPRQRLELATYRVRRQLAAALGLSFTRESHHGKE